MTGFGRAEAGGAGFGLGVEIRSVNHRHLDVALKIPRALASYEADARRLVQSRIERGRVDVTVQLTPAPGESASRVRVDEALAREYLERTRELGRSLDIGSDPELGWLAERPGVLRLEEPEPVSAEVVWPVVADTLTRALEDLVARRETEGEALAADLKVLHAQLGGHVGVMAARAPVAAERRGARLRERLTALLAGTAIDESRVVTEIAVWAEKTDISEELTRLGAHLTEFRLMLDKGGTVGRSFDFLIQEMNREVNTVASKADDLELSQATIAAKGTLEKIREQIQNLE